MELIIGGLAILFNMLDSLTTWLIDRLPLHLRSEEGNPFAKPWLEKYPLLAHTFKQIAVSSIVVLFIVFGCTENISPLMLIAIMFGLVVINNSYILIGRKITNRKIATPIHNACSRCHVPENCMYFVWLSLTMPMAMVISYALC